MDAVTYARTDRARRFAEVWSGRFCDGTQTALLRGQCECSERIKLKNQANKIGFTFD